MSGLGRRSGLQAGLEVTRGLALTTGTGCAQLGWKERTGQARDLGSMPRAEGGSRHSAASCPLGEPPGRNRQLGAREASPACEVVRTETSSGACGRGKLPVTAVPV